MRQIIRVNGYAVPWSANTTQRPIWTSADKMDAFLESAKTGYYKSYFGLDFNPEQKSFVLSPTSYNKNALNAIRKINYITIDEYTAQPIGESTFVKRYYYFVTRSTFAPVQDDYSNENYGSIIAEIKLDAWATYIADLVARQGGGVGIQNNVIIEQSHPIGGTNGANVDCIPAAAYPFGEETTFDLTNGDAPLVIKQAGTGGAFGAYLATTNGNTEKTTCFYFVAIFTRAGGGAPVCLCRPFEATAFTSAQQWATLSTLLTVDKITSAQVNGDFMATSTSGGDINVDLVRAYIIPRRIFQEDTATRYGVGWVIKHTIADGDDTRGYAFGEVITPSASVLPREIDVSIELNPEYIFSASRTFENTGKPAYVDVGTAYNRLQVSAPARGTRATIKARGIFTSAGFSLILQSGNRQIDVGADFEIPATDNPTAESFSRNKWATALQGVSHVGNIATAVATGNVAATFGATLSAGQFLAGIATAGTEPATLQSQGNGESVYINANVQGGDGYTLGAVFVRYIFPSSNVYPVRVRRFGWKWRGAFINTKADAARDIFSNGSVNPISQHPRGFLFIKTAGCVLIFSAVRTLENGVNNAAALVPEEYKNELQELFDAGLTIYYNPTAAGFGN